jgi:hypothetical protein
MPILTREGDCIGKVGELRERSFKVQTAFFRSYWLPSACVAVARQDRAVRLAIRKDEIEDYKGPAPVARKMKRPLAPDAGAWY